MTFQPIVLDNPSLPTAALLASRVPLFAPSIRRAAELKWERETPWGTVKVRGKLTQTHRGILDAMFSTVLRVTHLGQELNAPMKLLVDPYRITSLLGMPRNYQRLADRLEDLRTARVEVWDRGTGARMVGGIVSSFDYAPEAAFSPGGAVQGERKLLEVTISGPWMRVMRESGTLTYPALVAKIAALRFGASQALARFCLTHRTGYRTQLDTVLRCIDAIRDDMTDRAVRMVRADVQSEAAALAELGIDLSEAGAVHVKQHKAVWVDPVAAAEAEAIVAVAA